MSEDEVQEVTEVTETPTPPVKPRKAKAKAAPKAVKAKGKRKAKGNAKAKAKRHADPAKLDEYGFRLDSIKSKAAAMYAGKRGATLAEVKTKLKSTQFNVLTELGEKGFKIKREEEAGDAGRKVTRFFVK